MRICQARIVFHTPQKSTRRCTRCQKSHFVPLLSRIRGYTEVVKGHSTIDSPGGVDSSGTVPNDPDIITAESPEIRQPLLSSVSPPPPPSTPKTAPVKSPVHFRMVETKKGSRGILELQKATKETSLRKRLGWSNPLLGVNPAYDMALAFLTQDRKEKIRVIKHLQNRISHERQSGPPTSNQD